MKNMSKTAIIYAILAAALYAINIPLSKLLLNHIPPTLMAGFLYLGAGIGMFLLSIIHKENDETQKLTKAELPYTLGMIVLDIAAPIFLMFGLTMTNSANASLLNNFEIVATSIIALVCFKEIISPKLWTAILFITVSTIILSFEDMSAFAFSKGSLLILCACVCWGFENNCTRKLSSKSSTEIVVLKGLFSGMGSLIIGLVIKDSLPNIKFILVTLLLGFISYGLSIKFYIMAPKYLGASKTSAYYAISPF
jgi:Permeases of the drug/metabolite transporter (DMT) superfamily